MQFQAHDIRQECSSCFNEFPSLERLNVGSPRFHIITNCKDKCVFIGIMVVGIFRIVETIKLFV